MLRAAVRKQEALQREKERIQSQNQQLRERRNQYFQENYHKQHGTL